MPKPMCLAAQITFGEEGFFLQGTDYAKKYNPFGTPSNVLPGWAGRVGQVCHFMPFAQHPCTWPGSTRLPDCIAALHVL